MCITTSRSIADYYTDIWSTNTKTCRRHSNDMWPCVVISENLNRSSNKTGNLFCVVSIFRNFQIYLSSCGILLDVGNKLWIILKCVKIDTQKCKSLLKSRHFDTKLLRRSPQSRIDITGWSEALFSSALHYSVRSLFSILHRVHLHHHNPNG